MVRKEPDRTFVRDGVFHRRLSDLRNQVLSVDNRKIPAESPQAVTDTTLTEYLHPGVTINFPMESELEQLAFWDGIPGCHNFRYLMRKLEREVKRSKRYNRPCAVLVAAIDNFSSLQENFGAQSYSKTVLSVMCFLLDVVRSDIDILGRLSDEKYILVLPETSCAGAELFCRRSHKAYLDRQSEVGWRALPTGVSFGIAHYPGHGEESLELISRADLACEFSQRVRGSNFSIAAVVNPYLKDMGKKSLD